MLDNNIIYGINTVISYLRNCKSKVKKIYLIQGKEKSRKLQLIMKLSTSEKELLEIINEDMFYSKLKKYKVPFSVLHQNIVAIVDKSTFFYSEKDIASLVRNSINIPLVLVLDGVQDPHNMGACIRCADAAGVDFIIFSKNRGVGINATVEKVACGAVSSMKFVLVSNLLRSIKVLKKLGIWTIGLCAQSDKVFYDLD